MNNKKFYIYAHINDDKQEIFYIGKGHGNRAYYLNGRSDWHKNIVAKYNTSIVLLAEGLTENEAFNLEVKYIKQIGRRDLNQGPLVNLTDGGEGCTGQIVSKETRIKLSISHKGQAPWNKGQKTPKETRLKISISNKGNVPYMKGKKHTKEAKEKISKSSKGRVFKKQTKIKLSNHMKGRKHSLGYKHTKEAKEKIRLATTGRKHTEEAKINLSKSKIGNKNPMYGKKQSKELIELRVKNLRKIVLNTQTGIYHTNIKDMCEIFGLTYTSMLKKLSGQRNNNTPFIYA